MQLSIRVDHSILFVTAFSQSGVVTFAHGKHFREVCYV